MAACSSSGSYLEDLVDVELEVGEFPLRVRGMPAAFAVGPDSPGADSAVSGYRRGPALPGEALAVGGGAEPVIGDEVDKLVVVVADHVGGHGLGAVGERATGVVVVDRLLGNRSVDQGVWGANTRYHAARSYSWM